MYFNFVGEISYNGLDQKVPYFREISGDNPGLSLNLISIAASNNRAFVELAGFKNDPIKSNDTDNNKIEIDWDKRFDKEVIKKVANYKKHVFTLGDKRHEFITEMDFIECIINNIDEIKGKRFRITGDIIYDEYKGRIHEKFRMQNMYEVTDEKVKNDFIMTTEFFFTKDSLDLAEFAKEKVIYLNGYIYDYNKKEKKNFYREKQLVFDCSKVDFTNEKHVAILNYRLKQINCALDENNKIVSKLKKGKYYKIAVICKYANGNKEEEFSEADLTPNQKVAIELGISTIDDFRPSGKIYGDRVTIYKLNNFDLRGDYADGCVTIDDFDETQIYHPEQNESSEEVFSSIAMNSPVDEEETESDEDLFS